MIKRSLQFLRTKWDTITMWLIPVGKGVLYKDGKASDIYQNIYIPLGGKLDIGGYRIKCCDNGRRVCDGCALDPKITEIVGICYQLVCTHAGRKSFNRDDSIKGIYYKIIKGHGKDEYKMDKKDIGRVTQEAPTT